MFPYDHTVCFPDMLINVISAPVTVEFTELIWILRYQHFLNFMTKPNWPHHAHAFQMQLSFHLQLIVFPVITVCNRSWKWSFSLLLSSVCYNLMSVCYNLFLRRYYRCKRQWITSRFTYKIYILPQVFLINIVDCNYWVGIQEFKWAKQSD